MRFPAYGLECYTCDSSKGVACSYGWLSLTYAKMECTPQTDSSIVNMFTGLVPTQCSKIVGVGKIFQYLLTYWYTYLFTYYLILLTFLQHTFPETFFPFLHVPCFSPVHPTLLDFVFVHIGFSLLSFTFAYLSSILMSPLCSCIIKSS